MASCADGIRTLDDLRAFVHATLCARENLLPSQFRLTELRLRRQGCDCGLEFCLRGRSAPRPRLRPAVSTAVVYFYDAKGEPFGKVQLRRRVCQPVTVVV